MKHRLTKACDELRSGIAATERLIVERCRMYERYGKSREEAPMSAGFRLFW